MKFRLILVVLCMVMGVHSAFAEEVYLDNGDRISGEIVEETETSIVIETQAMGRISVDKNFVKKEKKIRAEGTPQWQRKISIGYSQTGGNTEASQGSGELFINRKTGDDEWTGKLSTHISTSNDEMDAKKFYGMGRYAFSYGNDLKWYNFYKFEADQDYFANINYRLIPSTGVGYWFSDAEDWKLMIEGAIGFEHTNYRDNTKSENEAILAPRGFLEKRLVGNLRISEDIILYPSLSEGGKYRLHSETALINSLSDKVSWKLSFIDDFNSDPSGNTKKNDFRLISYVDYAF